MKKITKVPNGPLVKKKGEFKGSTLKSGGKVKKAQVGMSVPKPKTGEHNGAPIGEYKPQGPSVGKYGGEGAPIGVSKYAKKGFKTGGTIKKAQLGGTYYATSKGRVGRLSSSKINNNISAIQNESIDTTGYSKGRKEFIKTKNKSFEKPTSEKVNRADVSKVISDLKKGATKKMDLRTPNQKKKNKMKAGGMIKRADGSYSQRGLWDNIRANKGSGKKPTKQMLQQEKKIKAKSKK